MKNRPDDLEMLQDAKPFLRSILAFLLYLRFGQNTTEAGYPMADYFLSRLEADLEKER